MSVTKWLSNLFKYGPGEAGRARKKQDRMRRRQAQFETERWQQHGDQMDRRYQDYAEYLSHQASKLPRIEDRLIRKEEQRFLDFQERFRGSRTLRSPKAVLCLGARLGTEVRAMHQLGHFAVGLDLNPGETNPYVLPGDFHKTVFPDDSVDVVYTNALDHVFDLGRVIREVCRILCRDGTFITDVVPGYEEGFMPGEFESHHWATVDHLIDDICRAAPLSLVSRRELGSAGSGVWSQLEFVKSPRYEPED